MIKIITGWSNAGGSTVAFINLVNELNKRGIEAKLYGAHSWHLGKCNADTLQNVSLNEEDHLIVHFFKTNWNQKPPIKGKMIWSCHEKDISPVNKINYKIYDKIQYVSEPQRQWHKVDHPSFIVPNILDELTPSKCKDKKIAGIIGSIDRNKQVHISILRALQDGMNKVYIFGGINDPQYYEENVKKLIDGEKVVHKGFNENKQEVYDQITDVYHSSVSECLSYVKRECMSIGMNFHGNESTDNEGYFNISNDEIIDIWKKELEL